MRDKYSSRLSVFFRTSIFFFLFYLLLFQNGLANSPKGLLGDAFSQEELKKILLSRDKWHPFPTVQDREAWEELPQEVREYLIKEGEAGLSYRWPALPATLFLDFVRTGNRSRYQKASFDRREMLADLVMAECVEGKGRFLDDIVNGIWAICEESYWGVPAHLSMQKAGHGLPDVSEPTVDLFAAETAALLSWTYYLLGDRLDSVSPLVRPRIELELDRRILTPCLERNDFWWMGFGERRVNNWNPWCNSNWLTTVLLTEKNKERRVAAVYKIMRSLDNFIKIYPEDGGCDEGPGYWGRAGASLFDCLELLHSATAGKINVYNQPLIKEIARYIYRVHIHDRYFINFADASAIVNVPADLIYRFGKKIDDKKMMAFGAYTMKIRSEYSFNDQSLGRRLPAIFNYSELMSAKAAAPYLRDVWLKDIQVFAARSKAGTPEGLYVAAKGGHNNESHNHNDVGNFIIYLDGQPMIIDVGVETYTKKTFSSRRYEIWTMQSAYHNLPTIGGIMQAPGRQYAARNVSAKIEDSFAELTLDIADAYPEEAGVTSWKRSIRLNRGKDILVNENYQLKKKVKDITLTLMTPCEVKKVGEDQILLTNPDARKQLLINHPKRLIVKIEEIDITDHRLHSVWGDKLRRILLIAQNPEKKDTWKLRFSQK